MWITNPIQDEMDGRPLLEFRKTFWREENLFFGGGDGNQPPMMWRAIDLFEFGIRYHAIGQTAFRHRLAEASYLSCFRFGIKKAQDAVRIVPKKRLDRRSSSDSDLW